jgi:hypothetical protein
MNDSTSTPIPFGPHHDSVRDPRLCLGIPAAGVTLVYCPRHGAGAMYSESTGRWMIQTPVEAVDFLKTLERPGLELPDHAAEAWLARIHQVERELEGGQSH